VLVRVLIDCIPTLSHRVILEISLFYLYQLGASVNYHVEMLLKLLEQFVEEDAPLPCVTRFAFELIIFLTLRKHKP
jgi:hypothetical protein